MGYRASWCIGWIGVGMLGALLVGCAPVRTVYIPQEWGVPERRDDARGQKPQESSPTERPILKPTPRFQEEEVPQSSGLAPTKESQASQEPQRIASMHLVDLARASLNQGNPDQAIAFLEQAIQVDGYNGEAFFGLARAWRMKGSAGKALGFARKAEILFQDEPARLKDVYLLEAEIYRDSGDVSAAQAYSDRAARL